MRCGNQETCEDYLRYVATNKEGFPIDKHDQIIVPRNGVYICRARDNQDCTNVRVIDLLEKIKNMVNE